jgi:hypothetical protein
VKSKILTEIEIDPKDKEEALCELVNNPVLFARLHLFFEPYGYQKEFLNEKSKREVVNAGRQVGKSTMAAAKAIWFAVTHPNTNTLIVSSTLRQSMLMFDKVRSMIYSGSKFVRNSVTKPTKREFTFSNGSKITALPCGANGHSLRGHTAHMVILDEAAFIPDDVISRVVSPMLSTTDGWEMLLSTPWDKDHTFYKVFNSPEWVHFHFPSSANPLVTKEFLEEQRELYGEERFAQEYLAEFVDDENSYFPSSLIRKCVHYCKQSANCSYCELFSSEIALSKLAGQGSHLYGGYDPGGKGDLAAFVIVEKTGSDLQVVHVRTYLSRGKGPEDENVYTRFTMGISDTDKILKLQRIYVDQTGLGNPIIENCRDLGLPAQGLTLTASTREELLANLKFLFEKNKITLPPENQALLNSLNCIEYDRRMGGGFSFTHRQGTHDDIAYALALAAWGATQEKSTVIMMKDQDEKEHRSWRDRERGIQ